MCRRLPPIDLPVLIFPDLSPGGIGVFGGGVFRGMNFALLHSIHHGAPSSCTTHATPSSCVSDHSHLLVVAPPSLPCSPPLSCLDPSLLSQASPLHRDTPRSHEDGGMHSRGRSRLFKLPSFRGCRVRLHPHTWAQVSPHSLSFKLLHQGLALSSKLESLSLFSLITSSSSQE